MARHLPTKTMGSRNCHGFTMVEVLAAAALLGVGVIGIASLTSVSRRFAEQGRGTSEIYLVARQEVERDKAIGFRGLFINSGNKYLNTNPFRTDYGNVTPNGSSLDADASDRANYAKMLTTANVSASASPATGCSTSACNGRSATTQFRAVSTYLLVSTGSETDNGRKLGIQKVQVYARSGSGFASTPIYETTNFYTDLTKW